MEEVKEKKTRERVKQRIVIQKQIDLSCGEVPPEGAEVFINVQMDQPIPTVVKAKSILAKLDKNVGDNFQIIGVKRSYTGVVEESTTLKEE